jgi:diguanylate cyclase (GGDEF)-like protein
MNNEILLVDDDPSAIQLLARILADSGNLRFATCGEDALRLALASPPDLILLDAEMPGLSGFEVCATIKATPALADTSVIFVTSHGEPAFEVAGFEIGGADFIAKPLIAPLVLARVTAQLRVKRMADELRRIATHDSLTGLANRRSFDVALDREWRCAQRSGDALTLLMIDVDHFKAFNDRYGHPAGDDCLQRIARALESACRRPADLVARHGGEEFAVVLPHTDRLGARHVADQILSTIQRIAIDHEGSSTARHVSVSIGIACRDRGSEGSAPPSAASRGPGDALVLAPRHMVDAADKALYAAKHAGRAQAQLVEIIEYPRPLRAHSSAA